MLSQGIRIHSLSQGNLNKIPIETLYKDTNGKKKQCFIKTRKPESIYCFSTQDTNGKQQGNVYCISVIPM